VDWWPRDDRRVVVPFIYFPGMRAEFVIFSAIYRSTRRDRSQPRILAFAELFPLTRLGNT
jgi:hypothetical protein